MQSKFFKCKKNDLIIHQFGETDCNLTCDGETLIELMPNTVEADVEKHIPVATLEGNKLTVKVGVTEHPQTEEHLIEWIYIKNGAHTQGKTLTYKDKPEAVFYGDFSGKIEMQVYCNKHGIWLSTVTAEELQN